MSAAGKKWSNRSGKHRKGHLLKVISIVFLFFIVVFATIYLMNQIRQIDVEGNEYYSEQEIKDLVINGTLEKNAWYLYLKYKYMDVKEIPFVDTIEVELTGTGKVKINVYEKSVVGYVEYLGKYMYFDKDGMIVESSNVKMDHIPMVTGLSFERIALHEQLPVANLKVFNLLLNLTQLLKKNEIWPDRISLSENSEMTLYFDQAKVMLGTESELEEKIVRLSYLTSQLQGMSGTMHMENFDENTKNITFEKEEP